MLKRAAQYVRMSTEHQKYSISHQSMAIAAYAASHGYSIVRTYADEGISGLRFQNRDGLKRLLADVVSGAADFSVILTYDVSRWGRFQDPDQAAHYEFVCREAGVNVIYCAEPFENDGSLTSTLVKQLKRAMAAEYSRELAVKVSAAQWNLAAKGYWMGGPPGFGFRRQLVRADGSRGPLLGPGEHKGLAGDHVILVSGPSRERALVRRIYRMFLIAGMSRAEVARVLNREGRRAENGAKWSPRRVHEVLTNEKYTGTFTFGRTRGQLITGRRRRDRAACLEVRTGLRPIVSRQTFDLVQRNIEARCRRMDDEQMLEGLARLLEVHGRLSCTLIDEEEDLPCADAYRKRFGGLLAAYARVGFVPGARALWSAAIVRKGQPCRRRNKPRTLSPEEMLERLSVLKRRVGYLSAQVLRDAPDVPGADAYCRVFGSLKRTYALVGYVPTRKQQLAMEGHERRALAR